MRAYRILFSLIHGRTDNPLRTYGIQRQLEHLFLLQNRCWGHTPKQYDTEINLALNYCVNFGKGSWSDLIYKRHAHLSESSCVWKVLQGKNNYLTKGLIFIILRSKSLFLINTLMRLPAPSLARLVLYISFVPLYCSYSCDVYCSLVYLNCFFLL